MGCRPRETRKTRKIRKIRRIRRIRKRAAKAARPGKPGTAARPTSPIKPTNPIKPTSPTSPTKHLPIAPLACLLALPLATACNSDVILDVAPRPAAPVLTQFTLSLPPTVTTRMSAATVQEGETFRGMDSMVLIPFGAAINDAASKLGEPILLQRQVKPTEAVVANNISTLTAASNSVLYEDVELPSGTSHFLFYGKAAPSATPEDPATDGALIRYGLTDAADFDPANIFFDLMPIAKADNATKRTALATYLTSIYTAWSGKSHSDDAITTLMNKFIQMKAGSSRAVQAALEDLYNALMLRPASEERNAVTAAITAQATVSGTTLTLNDDLQQYPGALGLPDGAAVLDFSGGAFHYVDNQYLFNNSLSLNITTIDTYVHPANLQYTVATDLRTSNASQFDIYDGTNTWASILAAYTDEPSVNQSTHSVALTQPVQYGVARFDVSVVASAASLPDQSGRTISGIGNGGMRLVGVLIGGQKRAKWDFTPVAAAKERVIYDRLERSQPAPCPTVGTAAPAQPQAYTLVLPTETGATVKVALELVNEASDFMGVGGQVIPRGCRFYLVGELNPATGTKPTGWTGGDVVFSPDCKTAVTFTISSLANAYYTIPDLRAPLLQLGLKVNLNWQAGQAASYSF